MLLDQANGVLFSAIAAPFNSKAFTHSTVEMAIPFLGRTASVCHGPATTIGNPVECILVGADGEVDFFHLGCELQNVLGGVQLCLLEHGRGEALARRQGEQTQNILHHTELAADADGRGTEAKIQARVGRQPGLQQIAVVHAEFLVARLQARIVDRRDA